MFSQLALHERLLKVLAEQSFVTPTPVQQAAIPEALAGRDLRVLARTGSGKTAAFLLPILDRLQRLETPKPDSRVLILLPTRELARQTLKEFERFARYTFIKATLVVGGEDFKVQAARLRKLPELIIGTPGRLLELLDAGYLHLNAIDTLVLDEADRMLDMGFSEDVLRLAKACPDNRQTLLFSATRGDQGLTRVIAEVLREPLELLIDDRGELAENLRQQIITADGPEHKEALLHWLLEHEPQRKAIVFCNTRAQAERLYGRLQARGMGAMVLHGEKDAKERKKVLERMREGGSKVLVATDVAARGLDLQGLDLVINFDMPRSGDEYVHRIGRTGRAGEAGLAVSLIGHLEWNLMSSIERYLKQHFERRNLPGLKAHYQGPKKLKASGKAAGSKKKKDAPKTATKKNVAAKPKNKGKRPSSPAGESAEMLKPVKKPAKDSL